MRPPAKILIAARLLLGQTQAEVAKDAKIGARTIFKLEHGGGDVLTVEKLVRHYESMGIVFLPPEPDKGWGLSCLSLVESFDQERERKRASKTNPVDAS